MAATLLWFSGAETGSIKEFPDGPQTVGAGGGSIVTTPVRTGVYALETLSMKDARVDVAGIGGASTTFLRCYFKIAANPSPAQPIIGLGTTTGRFWVWLNTNGTVGWEFASSPVGPTASGATAVSLTDWNLLEVKYVRSATVGGMEIFLNAVLQVSSFATSTTTGTSTSKMRISLGDPSSDGGGQTIWWDDLAYATTDYIGTGQSIAVQGKAGTPTYDTWTKNGDATAALCWSETPFSTAKNCSSGVLNDKQTMLTAALSAIDAGSTINGCLIGAVAKCASSFSSVKRMRRIGGVDTIGAANSTSTVDGWIPRGVNSEPYEVFVATLADLNASEIGAQANSGTIVNTIEDLWLLVDYTPGPPAALSRNGVLPVDVLQVVRVDRVIPEENSGLVTLRRNAMLPVEWETLLSRHGMIPIEWPPHRLSRDGFLPVELSGEPPGQLLLQWNILNKLNVPLLLQWTILREVLNQGLTLQFSVSQSMPSLQLRWRILPPIQQQFVDQDIHNPTASVVKTP